MSFGAVSPQLMLHAYAQGIFPMAENAEDHDLFWVDPKRRGILPLDGFHISRSLRRFLHGHKITATLNQAFDSVLQHCADREETWINPTLHANYTALHEMGCCHSLEVWDNGALLGGVFGIAIGRVWQEIEGSLSQLPSDQSEYAVSESDIAAAATQGSDELSMRRRARVAGE